MMTDLYCVLIVGTDLKLTWLDKLFVTLVSVRFLLVMSFPFHFYCMCSCN